MTAAPVTELREVIGQAGGLYHRLVLLVGPPGSGKTGALRRYAGVYGASLVNVNLELSRALLDIPRTQRAIIGQRLLGQIVGAHAGEIVLLDNIEILFAPEMKLDPLKALQQLSRNRTIVAAWSGRVEGDRLLYAEPSHPEFRDYPARGLMVVTPPARHGAAMA
jgi:hypothetical protein